MEQVEFNFEDFLNQIRVNHACELLITTELTVLDVALDVGYNSQKTLTRNFVKLKVATPSAFWANSAQKADGCCKREKRSWRMSAGAVKKRRVKYNAPFLVCPKKNVLLC